MKEQTRQTEEVYERWTGRLVWFILVGSLVCGAGWLSSYRNALRAQKAELSRLAEVLIDRGGDVEIVQPEFPPAALPWIHAFERVGYPIVVSFACAAALYLGAREHIRVVRDSIASFQVELRSISTFLRRKFEDMDGEMRAHDERISDLEDDEDR